MAAAWTVEWPPLRYPGAASHATHTRMLAIGCTGQAARNVSPERDPIGCTSQAARNVFPERHPVDCTGQAARNVSPERDSIGCAGQAARNLSPESDPLYVALARSLKKWIRNLPQTTVFQSFSLPAGTELHPAAPGITF